MKNLNAEEMLLADAIETAIKSERQVIRLKRIIKILGLIIAILIVLIMIK